MNCVNCGKPLRPGAMFCPQCGTQQPEQQPPDSQPAQYPPTAVIPDQEPTPSPTYDSPPETPDPYDYVPEPEKKPRWPLIVGVSVAALCLLCICLTVVGYLAYNQGWINF